MGKLVRSITQVGDNRLSVRLVRPPRNSLGTVFVPPLIGGTGMQQVHYFRGLNRMGYAIATFDYRGHGKSNGRFSIRTSITDSLAVLRDLLAQGMPQPLFGLGDCYAAIPLLVCASKFPKAFKALALMNAVPTLQHVAGPREILANYFYTDGRFSWRHPFDIKGMLAATNTKLFPHVDKSRDHFGILDYKNTHMALLVWEYLTSQPLQGVRVDVPTLVGYGTSDSILGLHNNAREEAYREGWRKVAPQSEMRPLPEIDHFFSETIHIGNDVPGEFFARIAGAPRIPEPTFSVTPAIDSRRTTSEAV